MKKEIHPTWHPDAKVIVNGDHDGDGYVVALAREDGHEVWRIARPNPSLHWTRLRRD